MNAPERPPPPGTDAALLTKWLQHQPLPAGVVLEGRYALVNAAFEALTGTPAARLVGTAFEDSVHPDDREPLRERYRRRLQGEPVPASYHCRVLHSSGAPRTVEAFIHVHEGALLFQLRDVTGADRRMQSLRSLVRLGADLQREHDEAAILKALGRGIVRLSASAMRLVPEGDRVRVAGGWAEEGRLAAIGAALGHPLIGAVLSRSATFQRAWEEGAAYSDDPRAELLAAFGTEREQGLRRYAQHHEISRGIIVRIERGGRPRELLTVNAPWLRPEDMSALQLFAAQIGAALDSAERIADLSRRNAELSALNRMATLVGSARSLGDLFASTGDELRALFQCEGISFFLLDDAGMHAEHAYSVGDDPQGRAEFRRMPLSETRMGVAVRERRVCAFEVSDYPPAGQQHMKRSGLRVVITAPLVFRSRVVGLMNLGYAGARALEQRDLDVVSAVCVQLAAAIDANHLVQDLRRSYDQLSSAQQQVVAHERLAATGEMASGLAHEIRNPLGVVSNALTLIRRSSADRERLERYLGIASEELERMNRLVEDLLLVSRPARPQITVVSLEALVREATRPALEEAAGKVRLELDLSSGLGDVTVDTRLMLQAFQNVARNAVQAMPAGGTLTVRALPSPGRPEELEVSFADTGHGIPEAAQRRAFEPFFTTAPGRTGLGLALVKRFVEAHRGAVELESAVGRGTTVRIRWPALAEWSR